MDIEIIVIKNKRPINRINNIYVNNYNSEK